LTPPSSPAAASRHLHHRQQHREPPQVSLLPSPPSPPSSSSSASSSPPFTLHVNNGEAHCLMGWQRWPSPKWLERVRPNSKCFFTNFCLVFGWYFYTKKIQIQYWKYPVFVNFWKIQKKTIWKKKKIFLCKWPSVSKLKNHIVFFIKRKKPMF
jgi:hypothetical protein